MLTKCDNDAEETADNAVHSRVHDFVRDLGAIHGIISLTNSQAKHVRFADNEIQVLVVDL